MTNSEKSRLFKVGPIRIGSRDFRVSVLDQMMGEETDAWGVTDPSKQEFRLSGQGEFREMQRVLLHEVMHVVYSEAIGGILMKRITDDPPLSGVDLDEIEELIVDKMSGWLILVLQDNPRLVSFLRPKQEN